MFFLVISMHLLINICVYVGSIIFCGDSSATDLASSEILSSIDSSISEDLSVPNNTDRLSSGSIEGACDDDSSNVSLTPNNTDILSSGSIDGACDNNSSNFLVSSMHLLINICVYIGSIIFCVDSSATDLASSEILSSIDSSISEDLSVSNTDRLSSGSIEGACDDDSSSISNERNLFFHDYGLLGEPNSTMSELAFFNNEVIDSNEPGFFIDYYFPEPEIYYENDIISEQEIINLNDNFYYSESDSLSFEDNNYPSSIDSYESNYEDNGCTRDEYMEIREVVHKKYNHEISKNLMDIAKSDLKKK